MTAQDAMLVLVSVGALGSFFNGLELTRLRKRLERLEAITRLPCKVCGAHPGDPHDPLLHASEKS
jgi:hypothetical protein